MAQLLRDVVPLAGGELVDSVPSGAEAADCLAIGPKDGAKSGPAAKEARLYQSVCPLHDLKLPPGRGVWVVYSRSASVLPPQVKSVVGAGASVYEPDLLLAGIVQQRLDLGAHKIA